MPYTHAALGDGSNAARGKIFEQLRDNAHQESDGSYPVDPAQAHQDDRGARCSRSGHDSGEVGVEGDHDSMLGQGEIENLVIRSGRQPDVAYVDDIPSFGEKVNGCPSGEAHVEE